MKDEIKRFIKLVNHLNQSRKMPFSDIATDADMPLSTVKRILKEGLNTNFHASVKARIQDYVRKWKDEFRYMDLSTEDIKKGREEFEKSPAAEKNDFPPICGNKQEDIIHFKASKSKIVSRQEINGSIKDDPAPVPLEIEDYVVFDKKESEKTNENIIADDTIETHIDGTGEGSPDNEDPGFVIDFNVLERIIKRIASVLPENIEINITINGTHKP